MKADAALGKSPLRPPPASPPPPPSSPKSKLLTVLALLMTAVIIVMNQETASLASTLPFNPTRSPPQPAEPLSSSGITAPPPSSPTPSPTPYLYPDPLQIQPRAPLTHAPSTPLLPTFLGIGPAKSGTTALIELLRPLRGVRIGELYTRSYAEEKRANGKFWPELAFFLDTDSFHSTDSIAYYESLFKVETRQPYEGEQIVAVGEKTPAYSGFPLTPYQVKDKLGGDVNLLFTVRDPVEAVVSKCVRVFAGR